MECAVAYGLPLNDASGDAVTIRMAVEPYRGNEAKILPMRAAATDQLYSTVTLFARLRGLSTSQPRRTAMW
ncbi:hypothetical protein MFFC18_09320 [Mariniblastus fucicola]|uniref:Uncharacterized protein n=1 Tax=Mariniblastus fucicola TaxID=980251 RepID=A0A5B9P883_9BACT|nr:hypothetical protein MFFC18_09320 [Mariniblastus fucicola]